MIEKTFSYFALKNARVWDTPLQRGRLSFDGRRQSTVLSAASVVILGGELAAGSPGRPFPGAATVRLVGDRSSPSVVVDHDSGEQADRVLGGSKVGLRASCEIS
jgi:hypothetical protein